MKKKSLIIALSTLFFACGSNAENQEVKEAKILEKINVEIVSEDNFTEVSTIEEIVTQENIEVEVLNELDEEKVAVEKTIIEVKEVLAEAVVLDEKILMDKHETWNSLLKKNVSSSGKVNYKGMKSSLPLLEKYLKHLKENTPNKEWSKNEKLAYWINLYNASTVHLIASNYPTSSITKLSGGKPWDKKFVKSGDKIYSLNQIENEIVRPRFKDPRIHAALNCAAVSCPSLLNEAFIASTLNNQLNKQCEVWVNDATKNKLENSKVKVSQIFDWYAADFKAGGGVVSFLNKYATTKVSATAKVSYLEYDWALNE